MKRRSDRTNNPQPGTGSPQPDEPVFVVVGKLRRPHGVKGELLMDIETDFPQRLRPHKVVYVGEDHEPLTIRSVRGHDRAMIVAFTGLDDVEMVGRLRNLLVYVKGNDLPSLPEGEYYFHQLLNLRVLDESGLELGRLTDILETGANDVYVVATESGKELLLPVIEDVILAVDLQKGEMVVRPQEWS